MQYRDDAELDQSQVSYSKGRGRTGGIALGGGAGLLVIVLALVFGVDLSSILGSEPESPATSYSGAAPTCDTGADIESDRECRWVAYVNSIQGYWKNAYPGYQPAKTIIFEGAASTACGSATSAVGPFYCPADQQVYIDTDYAQRLLDQLGAEGGDAAEAYILAHEYGHHISNSTGTLSAAQSSGSKTGPNKSAQTRLELQADCYAGVWFANTAADSDSAISKITADDLDRVIDAAKAVGDDNIQMQSTGGITPESWTHGSSAMRKHWVQVGFESGDPKKCDTFAIDDLDG